MTNPPKTQEKFERIRALQPIRSTFHGRVIMTGEEIDLPAGEVKEFCDRRFKGPLAGAGELADQNPERLKVRRAIRISEVKRIEADNARKAAQAKKQGSKAGELSTFED